MTPEANAKSIIDVLLITSGWHSCNLVNAKRKHAKVLRVDCLAYTLGRAMAYV